MSPVLLHQLQTFLKGFVDHCLSLGLSKEDVYDLLDDYADKLWREQKESGV